MKKGLKTRIVFVLVVAIIAILYAVPGLVPGNKINLGLDLKGGTHLILQVDCDEAVQAAVGQYINDIKLILRKNNVYPVSVTCRKDSVRIKLKRKQEGQKAASVLSAEYRDWNIEIETEGLLVMKMTRAQVKQIENAVQREAVKTIRNRIDEFGVAEPSIQPQGKNRIVVQLPGLKDPERAKAIIGKTAKLSFHIGKKTSWLWNLISKIDRSKETGIENYLHNIEGIGMCLREADTEKIAKILEREDVVSAIPANFMFAFGKIVKDENGEEYRGLYLIKRKPELGGQLLKNAYVGYQQMRPVVNIQFKRRGALLFERVTESNIGEPLAIVLDGIVQSAPVIQDKIPRTSTGFISGRFSTEEAKDTAIMLTAGALPASITIEFEQTVGPSLGSDSVQRGINAMVAGTIFVLLFMLVYYLVCGLIADFALVLNLLILIACLAGLGATLTLPGIAGIILTIGMSVDANVLIFERIREEIRNGKTIRISISSGYRKAIITILDANVTTLIAALVLFQFGTGPVRGFAVTLSIGIAASMFTAIVVTRLILDILASRRKFSHLPMLQMFKSSNIQFSKAKTLAFLFSILLIAAGATSLVSRGNDNLGIDFRGGILLMRKFSKPVPIQRIRESLAEAGFEKSVLQQFGKGDSIMIRTDGGQKTAAAVDKCLDKEFGNILLNPAETGKTSFVGPIVGKDLSRHALFAIIFSLLGIVIYVSWRFQFKFAIAAIIALVHDVVITLGVFSITGREITLPVIAAVLTIIGYSLNDTIVLFDRIRENLRLHRKGKFESIANHSINQVLSRTLLTSFTTFIVVLSLFLFGGKVINDFAFVMLIGIIIGTYSSIFVASPLLVLWNSGKKRILR